MHDEAIIRLREGATREAIIIITIKVAADAAVSIAHKSDIRPNWDHPALTFLFSVLPRVPSSTILLRKL